MSGYWEEYEAGMNAALAFVSISTIPEVEAEWTAARLSQTSPDQTRLAGYIGTLAGWLDEHAPVTV